MITITTRKRIKRKLQDRQLTYVDVGSVAGGVSWNMVWKWLHNHKTSAPLDQACFKLTGIRVKSGPGRNGRPRAA